MINVFKFVDSDTVFIYPGCHDWHDLVLTHPLINVRFQTWDIVLFPINEKQSENKFESGCSRQ